MNARQYFTSLICIGGMTLICGCMASRSVTYDDGGPIVQSWTPPTIPARPAGQEKIAVGVMVGMSKDEIARYPQLVENNLGLGLDFVVREQLLNSNWFDIAPIDPQMIVMFENLKDYYWAGQPPEDGQMPSSQKPEYILIVGLTRVGLQGGSESVVGGTKTFKGACEVKVNFESYSLLSAYPNLHGSTSGTGVVSVKETGGLFAGGGEFRSSAFGTASDRAVQDAVPKLIQRF